MATKWFDASGFLSAGIDGGWASQAHRVGPGYLATSGANSKDATLPLLFSKTKEGVQRATLCYRELLLACKLQGFLPYRLGIEFMEDYLQWQHPATQELHRNLKRALDPNDIVAPGRYVEANLLDIRLTD